MSENGENTIRVLIVDDIAETRENLRKLLQFEADVVVVGAARTGVEAIDIARETEPDVVIMDINMPDMDGIAATEALLRDVPFAQIVMLSVNNDADYVRRAMRAGARDFLAKPPSGDELISTIRTLSAFAHEQKDKLATPLPALSIPGSGGGYAGSIRPQGKVIALYSPKGGVGCTVIATNLAVGLNNVDTPTVLVDAHLQFGDVAVALNLQAKNSFVDLASRAEELDAEYVESVLLRHDATDLHVLAAPGRPEMADEVSAEQVRNVLQFLKRIFAYVIVDTSSNMDDITLAVLDVADILVTIATPEIPSIKDTRLLFDLLGVLEFPKERIFFILNKMDKRSGITTEAVTENLKIAVDGEIPLDERVITTSINKGSPVLISDKGQPSAKAILNILGVLKERMLMEPEAEAEPEAERPRLFSR
ncbi:MAG: CobQ/CobB/MinD/ParA nucleotide binding domain-containing protein [Anaerolineales bacterium]|nr:MAG: CobQ/CobB/MinD/ParA nucleotide binding domain-containing protein [Anaerolineales bacterium]